MKKTLSIGLIATFFMLTGCASNGPIIVGNESISHAEAFKAGKVRLECTWGCGYKLGLNLKEIDALIYSHSWNELSTKVMDIGFGGDLTYYYLGRAAEGLKYFPAAKTYYELSLTATEKCDKVTKATCQGHNFPDDINKHLENIKGK